MFVLQGSVVINTLWYRPLCLGFLGVAASSLPQLSLVFLCKNNNNNKVMNLGLPQPTAKIAGRCPMAGIAHVKPAPRVSWGRWRYPTRLCKHRSSAEALHAARPPWDEPPARSESTQTSWDKHPGPADFNHCKVLTAA